MFLFQKRLMTLSQSSQQPIRLKPKFYSLQKENMPIQKDLPKVNLIHKLNEASKMSKSQPKQQVLITQKTISKDIWHKKSISMKMKKANFKDGKKIISGQLIKYKKGDQIYAFRCIDKIQNYIIFILQLKINNILFKLISNLYFIKQILFFKFHQRCKIFNLNHMQKSKFSSTNNIKDTMKQCKLKDLKLDHDVDTDDEQIFMATKNMFMSLCQSIKRELFNNQDEQNNQENKIIIDDDFL